HRRSPPARAVDSGDLRVDAPDGDKKSGHRRDQSQPGRHSQRRRRKSDVARESKPDEFTQRVFWFAGMPRVAFIFDADLTESYPTAQPAQEPVPLFERDQSVDHAAVQETKLPGVERHIDLRDGPQRAIEDGVSGALPERLLTLLPHSVNDIITLPPMFYELFEQLGRVLKIGVHQN